MADEDDKKKEESGEIQGYRGYARYETVDGSGGTVLLHDNGEDGDIDPDPPDDINGPKKP